MTEFTRDFTHNRIKNWEILLSEFMGKPDLRFLEIGTFEGRSAIWFLENILTSLSSRLTIIDPFMMIWEHKFAGMNPLWNDKNVVNEVKKRFYNNIKPYREKVSIMESLSYQGLVELNERCVDPFDFIYIDGSHKASDCLADMVLSLPLLKQGGIMLMDDYLWGKQLPEHFTPHPAIDAFMSIYREEVIVISKGTQVALRKK
jgi:predicted O-methyltransferase YrrM